LTDAEFNTVGFTNAVIFSLIPKERTYYSTEKIVIHKW